MQYSVEQRDHVTVLTCSGPFDIDGAKGMIRRLWSAGQFVNPYALVDLRACTKAMEAEDLKIMSDFVRQSMNRRNYGRIALVVRQEDIPFVELYIKSIEGAPFEVEHFTLRAEALSWLETMI